MTRSRRRVTGRGGIDWARAKTKFKRIALGRRGLGTGRSERIRDTEHGVLQLLALPPAKMIGEVVSRAGAAQSARSTHDFENCWFTVRILVPSSGLMSFQGVGFSLVQTTTGLKSVFRAGRGESKSRTGGSARETGHVPAGTADDQANDGVATSRVGMSPTKQGRSVLTSESPTGRNGKFRVRSIQEILHTSTANQFLRKPLRRKDMAGEWRVGCKAR